MLSLITKPIKKQPLLFRKVLIEYTEKTILEESLSKSTARKYYFFISNIEKYLNETGQWDILLDDVRIKTMEQLRTWLQQNLVKCSIGYASRHLELCKRVMRYAVWMEYTLNNPLDPIMSKRDKVKEVVHLEENEIELMRSAEPQKELYKAVRDLYLFQAFTGLSYADLYTYSVIESNGVEWVCNRRVKNDNPYYVPLFPEAKEIHSRYHGTLPVIVNAVYNLYLRKFAKSLGINKHLTTHTARKTFASIMDQRGVSPKTIADMMGNTIQVLQKHYLAKSTKRIENELLALKLLPEKPV